MQEKARIVRRKSGGVVLFLMWLDKKNVLTLSGETRDVRVIVVHCKRSSEGKVSREKARKSGRIKC